MTIPLARLLYVVLLLVGVVFLWVTGSFPDAQSPRDIGPAAFPRWLAGLMIALILIDLVLSWRRSRRVALSEVGMAAAVAGGTAATVWLGTQIGLLFALPPALFAGLWLAGSRALIANAVYSLALPAGVWLLFERLLQLPIGSM